MANSETASPSKKPARIIACGMIAREVLAINEQISGQPFDLKCLPAEFHHHPRKIAPALDIAISAAKSEGYRDIIVGYADCGSGGEIDKVCEKHRVTRINGPHCFAFYLGNDQFDQNDGDYITTFFITDFLARHFETFLLIPLGLDKHPELLPMYFGNYTRALYLAQTQDRELDDKAKAAAKFLGLTYERQFTGYGDLSTALKKFSV